MYCCFALGKANVASKHLISCLDAITEPAKLPDLRPAGAEGFVFANPYDTDDQTTSDETRLIQPKSQKSP